MADVVPAKLKSLQLGTFAKRAAQLERFKPVVTYWLRFFIVQKIIASGLHSADAECTAYTTDLMEKLEQAKAENPAEDALLDDVAAAAYVEQFSLQTFVKGDREMSENKVNANTADTLLAASTFFEILSIWKKDSEQDIASKIKYAKYHALRIIKAIKAHEDPNVTNPVREPLTDTAQPPALDLSDPEVQRIAAPQAFSAPTENPYQSYVESAPDTFARASPDFPVSKVSPPPGLPSAPAGYSHSSHNDVSPISQPASRQGSVVSVGGGYFPRMTPPPTFTAGDAAPNLPTAPSLDDAPPAAGVSDFQESFLPTDSQTPQAPQAPDPLSFYQNPASLIPTAQPLEQPPQQSLAPLNPYNVPTGQNPYVPSPSQLPQTPHQYSSSVSHLPQSPPQLQQAPPQPPPQKFPPEPRQNPYAKAPAPPPQPTSQAPFRNDEDSIIEAQKHAKWAISALNFEDVNTAVKELRIALRALGAN